ncbi:MAG: hypothetical protein WD766_06440 [Gemmatimonadota bacterium]
MNVNLKHIILVPVLALAVLAAGCGDQYGAESLLGPDMQPSMAKGGNGEKGKSEQAKAEKDKGEKGKAKKDKAEKKGPKVKGRKKNGAEAEYRLAVSKRKNENGPAIVWLDATSPKTVLRVGQHTLTIPAGIVEERTKFSMAVQQRDYENDEVLTSIQLLATETKGKGRNASEVDVGVLGFNGRTIELCVSYDGVLDVEDADLDDATLLWLQPAGSHEVVDSRVDPENKLVCSGRGHFSDYGLAWPTSR